jgi:hypothetical protein
MKKIAWVIAALCAALVVVGCASTPTASEAMEDARRSAPSGALVGMASAKEKNKDESLKKSDTLAKAQLVRAMSFIAKDMVDEAVADGIIDSGIASEFRKGIDAALGRISYPASRLGQGTAKGNEAWTVWSMDKAGVTEAITEASNVSKNSNPGAAGFNPKSGIDKAYNTHAGKEWKN